MLALLIVASLQLDLCKRMLLSLLLSAILVSVQSTEAADHEMSVHMCMCDLCAEHVYTCTAGSKQVCVFAQVAAMLASMCRCLGRPF